MYLLPTYTERVTKPTINKEKRKKEKRKKEMVSRKKKSPQFIWQRIISLVKSKAFKMIQHSVLPAIRITIIVFGYFNGLRVWEKEQSRDWDESLVSLASQFNITSSSDQPIIPIRKRVATPSLFTLYIFKQRVELHNIISPRLLKSNPSYIFWSSMYYTKLMS